MLESDHLPGHHACAENNQVRRQRRQLSHVDRIRIGVTEAAAASASQAKASAGTEKIDRAALDDIARSMRLFCSKAVACLPGCEAPCPSLVAINRTSLRQ